LPFLVPAFKARIKMMGTLTEPEFSAEIDHEDTDVNGLKNKKRKNSHTI
jgi:hypothetical protein